MAMCGLMATLLNSKGLERVRRDGKFYETEEQTELKASSSENTAASLEARPGASGVPARLSEAPLVFGRSARTRNPRAGEDLSQDGR